jgi:colicin import membrane protein
MMSWLLKYEGYPSGVVVAILVHALMVYILLPKNLDPADMVKIEQPSYVSATVTKDNPQRLRQLQELERQRQQEEARERRNREAARAAEEQQKREQAKLEADRKLAQQKLEAEAQAKKEREQAAATEREQQAAEDARQKQEQTQRDAERERIAAQEQAARETAAKEAADRAAAQAQALSAENQLIAQYTSIIHDVVSRNWIQPPSARNGMQVLVNIKLVPTGEIIASVVIQSSGDPIFDRSALQAVDKSGSFPELRDLPIAVFERNFRDFNLLFSPEDLLR